MCSNPRSPLHELDVTVVAQGTLTLRMTQMDNNGTPVDPTDDLLGGGGRHRDHERDAHGGPADRRDRAVPAGHADVGGRHVNSGPGNGDDPGGPALHDLTVTGLISRAAPATVRASAVGYANDAAIQVQVTPATLGVLPVGDQRGGGRHGDADADSAPTQMGETLVLSAVSSNPAGVTVGRRTSSRRTRT